MSLCFLQVTYCDGDGDSDGGGDCDGDGEVYNCQLSREFLLGLCTLPECAGTSQQRFQDRSSTIAPVLPVSKVRTVRSPVLNSNRPRGNQAQDEPRSRHRRCWNIVSIVHVCRTSPAADLKHRHRRGGSNCLSIGIARFLKSHWFKTAPTPSESLVSSSSCSVSLGGEAAGACTPLYNQSPACVDGEFLLGC